MNSISITGCAVTNNLTLPHSLKCVDVGVTLEPQTTERKLIHLLNVNTPTVVTDGGIVIDVKLLHPPNACASIRVTDGGTIIDIKLVHLLNAEPPIVVTDGDRVTDVKRVHP